MKIVVAAIKTILLSLGSEIWVKINGLDFVSLAPGTREQHCRGGVGSLGRPDQTLGAGSGQGLEMMWVSRRHCCPQRRPAPASRGHCTGWLW